MHLCAQKKEYKEKEKKEMMKGSKLLQKRKEGKTEKKKKEAGERELVGEKERKIEFFS
jgi:hypothetical protein